MRVEGVDTPFGVAKQVRLTIIVEVTCPGVGTMPRDVDGLAKRSPPVAKLLEFRV